MFESLHHLSSALASATRLGLGGAVGPVGARPAEPIQLYEFEGCPYCRKVREAVSILDLDAFILPCPKNGPRYRPELVRRGGKAQFPYLVDPNTGAEMYESDAIVHYLFERYGAGPPPWLLRPGWLNDVSTGLANSWRIAQGAFYRPARVPAKPLVLYAFEASPDGRRVRERLSCLELAYELRSSARGSAKSAVADTRAPRLIDPNTGDETAGARDILDHLDRHYAL